MILFFVLSLPRFISFLQTSLQALVIQNNGTLDSSGGHPRQPLHNFFCTSPQVTEVGQTQLWIIFVFPSLPTLRPAGSDPRVGDSLA